MSTPEMPTPHDAQQPIAQQPVASQGMVINPKNSLNKPEIAGKGREWSNDLCGCNIGTFCLAGCLPCIAYGGQKRRLNHLERNGTPDPDRGGNAFNGNCLLYGVLGCYGPCVLHPIHRAQIRDRYGIGGGDCTDFWTAWCCSPCALAQEEREIELEEKALDRQRDEHKD